MLKNLVSIKALLVEEGSRPEAEEETKLDGWGRQQKAQSVPFGMGNVVATEGAFQFSCPKLVNSILNYCQEIKS